MQKSEKIQERRNSEISEYNPNQLYNIRIPEVDTTSLASETKEYIGEGRKRKQKTYMVSPIYKTKEEFDKLTIAEKQRYITDQRIIDDLLEHQLTNRYLAHENLGIQQPEVHFKERSILDLTHRLK